MEAEYVRDRRRRRTVVILGIILAITIIKWLFILAVIAALVWVILFFVRRTA